MAVVKTTSLRFYTFVFVGFLLVVLNEANGQTTASSSSTTEAPSTFHALPRTMIPVTGYGHFNVSNCILLDVSCSVSVDLHVDKEVQAVSYDLPTNAVPSGNCTSKISSITLTWTHKGKTHLWLTMTIKNGDTKWETSKLGFRATAVNQSSLITNGTEREVNAWQNDTSKLKMAAGSGKSFKCDQNLDITLQGNVKVTVTIKKIQLQPFGGEGDASFGKGDTATSYPPPTTTPPPPPATTSDNHTTAPAPTTKPDNKTTTVVPTTKPDNKTTTAVPTTKPDNKTTTAVPTTKPDNKTTAPVPTTKPDNETTTPMTTPKPTTPPPPPPHGNFSLKENGSYCLLAQFAASITIHYVEVIYFTNSSNITKDASLTQHVNRTTEHDIKISGDCGRKGNKAKLILSWPKKDSFYELTMDIDKVVAASASGNKTSWSVAKITFNVTVKGNPDFKNATVTEPFVLSIYNKSTGNPRGQVGENYFCKDDVPVSFENDKKDFNVDSMFEDLRIEPFVNKTGSSDFGNNTLECYKDNPTTPAPSPTKKKNSDIVPIAVGCALAGLVLIVLIAYVIGRRKSHSGYEKV